MNEQGFTNEECEAALASSSAIALVVYSVLVPAQLADRQAKAHLAALESCPRSVLHKIKDGD